MQVINACFSLATIDGGLSALFPHAVRLECAFLVATQMFRKDPPFLVNTTPNHGSSFADEVQLNIVAGVDSHDVSHYTGFGQLWSTSFSPETHSF